MVAKAKGDLLDFTVGGAGFHVTAHLIALAALFIACFAIAGYITFRDDSVPASALKDQSDVLTKEGLTWKFEKEFELSTLVQTTDGDVVAKTGLVLPADAVIVNTSMLTQVASVGGTAGLLSLERGARNVAVGGALNGTPITSVMTNGNTPATDILVRGSSVGAAAAGIGAMTAEQEVYFSTSGNQFTAQGTQNPKIIATVFWTGSAPVAY